MQLPINEPLEHVTTIIVMALANREKRLPDGCYELRQPPFPIGENY